MGRQVIRSVAVRTVAAVAVVGTLVSGCGGPSQTGSAAIVGSTVVPASVVQARLDQTFARTEIVDELAAQGVGTPDIARDIVTQGVLHELSQQAARAEDIVVTPADIDAELEMLGGAEAVRERSLFDVDVVRERLGDELVAERLAAKQVNGLAVTVDIIGVGSRREAEEAVKVVAAGGPAADQLFAANPETSRRGYEYRASVNPDVAVSAVFGTPVGGSGYFQAVPGQETWVVFRVLSRMLDAPPVAPELDVVPQLGKSGLAEIGIRLLQPYADQAGVRVNPRYGVWDPVSMRVLDEEQVAGEVLPPPPAPVS